MNMYNPIEVEKEILEFWQKNNIYEKAKKQETTHTNNRSSLVVDHNGPIEISWPDGIITVKGKVVITLLSVLVISIASFLLF